MGNGCQLDQASCEVSIEQGNYRFTSAINPIPLEEEVRATITFPEQALPGKMWVEGINMYMGKIPFIVESQQPGQVKGIFFLGSCSEPDMRWQLVAEFTHNQQTRRIRFLFETHR